MAIKLVNNDSTDYTNPDSAGVAGLDERLDLIDDKGNTVASFVSDADGARTLTVGGVKRYKALLTQSGTDAPVATVLENTLGNAVWTREGNGAYQISLSGTFVASKTVMNYRQITVNDELNAPKYYFFARVNDDSLSLVVGEAATPTDDVLNQYPIEILVYP